MLHIAQGMLVVFILLTILFYLRTERSYLYLVLNVLSYTVVVNYTNYQNTRYNHYKILIMSEIIPYNTKFFTHFFRICLQR